MDWKDILSVSGKPGLYKNIAQTKSGVIIESLIDGKRLQAFANDKISSLGEISIFTTGDDLPIREVFRLAYAKNGEQPAPGFKADAEELKAYFEDIVPEYDRDRVYVSHMRKITSWYNLLLANGITDFSETPEETKGEPPAETEEEKVELPGEPEKPAEE